MFHRRFLLFVAILALLLPACVPYTGSGNGNAQVAQLPDTTQKTDPTTPPVVSGMQGPVVSTGSTVEPSDPPNTCPVTTPPDPLFTPPAPYPEIAPWDNFWYGIDSLWIAVPNNGVWSDLPHNPEGYTQKVFWWRKGYSWTKEPEPDLSVTGHRLDAAAPPLNVSKATNAYASDIGSAMLVGVDFPTLGCWEITGRYAGTELSFVVWIAP